MEMQSGPVSVLKAFAPRTPVLRCWQREWERWAASAEADAGLHRWSTDPVLGPHTASAGALLAACGRDLSVPVVAADRVLAALVGRARAGDPVAGRVALERLVPALTAQAGRRRSRRASFEDVFAELVGAAWIVIRCYPVELRPVRVAANLVRDAVGVVFGYVPVMDRRTDPAGLAPLAGVVGGGGEPVVGGPRAAVGVVRPSPLAELFAVLVDGRAAGVPGERLRVLAELGIVGLSQREVAERAGVSERTVRRRRDAAVAALRSALLPVVA